MPLSRLSNVFACLVVLTSLPVIASAACKPADASMAGAYYMRGVMEMGSIIALAPDGRFRYMLSYGAYDERAEGCWQRRGNVVSLTPTKMLTGPGGKKFKRLDLQRNASGELLRKLGPRHTGRYVRSRR
jgi:hypothetical protein